MVDFDQDGQKDLVHYANDMVFVNRYYQLNLSNIEVI